MMRSFIIHLVVVAAAALFCIIPLHVVHAQDDSDNFDGVITLKVGIIHAPPYSHIAEIGKAVGTNDDYTGYIPDLLRSLVTFALEKDDIQLELQFIPSPYQSHTHDFNLISNECSTLESDAEEDEEEGEDRNEDISNTDSSSIPIIGGGLVIEETDTTTTTMDPFDEVDDVEEIDEDDEDDSEDVELIIDFTTNSTNTTTNETLVEIDFFNMTNITNSSDSIDDSSIDDESYDMDFNNTNTTTNATDSMDDSIDMDDFGNNTTTNSTTNSTDDSDDDDSDDSDDDSHDFDLCNFTATSANATNFTSTNFTNITNCTYYIDDDFNNTTNTTTNSTVEPSSVRRWLLRGGYDQKRKLQTTNTSTTTDGTTTSPSSTTADTTTAFDCSAGSEFDMMAGNFYPTGERSMKALLTPPIAKSRLSAIRVKDGDDDDDEEQDIDLDTLEDLGNVCVKNGTELLLPAGINYTFCGPTTNDCIQSIINGGSTTSDSLDGDGSDGSSGADMSTKDSDTTTTSCDVYVDDEYELHHLALLHDELEVITLKELSVHQYYVVLAIRDSLPPATSRHLMKWIYDAIVNKTTDTLFEQHFGQFISDSNSCSESKTSSSSSSSSSKSSKKRDSDSYDGLDSTEGS